MSQRCSMVEQGLALASYHEGLQVLSGFSLGSLWVLHGFSLGSSLILSEFSMGSPLFLPGMPLLWILGQMHQMIELYVLTVLTPVKQAHSAVSRGHFSVLCSFIHPFYPSFHPFIHFLLLVWGRVVGILRRPRPAQRLRASLVNSTYGRKLHGRSHRVFIKL